MAQQKAENHAQKSYLRFSLPQRMEHIILIVSFTTLGITGLIQKFSANPLAFALIDLLGGIEATRIIHRIAAIIFVLQSVYHILIVGYKMFVTRREMTMLPGLRDATDAIDVLRYNLGLLKHHPKMPRYNFAEKAEYWALVWGGIVMAITGFMLWNPIATAKFLPGQFIPAAKAAHGGEAILAVLAIIVWHFYSVHIKFFNKSMFTGKLARHHMEVEHGEELGRIESGQARLQPDPAGVRRRERIYLPVALIVGLIFTVGIYWFATFEETAVATVPPPPTEVPAFLPLTPTPVPENTRENNEIGSPITHPIEGREECDSCHGLSGVKPYPADHEGRPNDSCEVCHAVGPTPTPGGEQPAGGDGAANPIPHPIEGEAYETCTVCHGPGMQKPFPENHNDFPLTACTSCHEPVGEAAGADETPAAGETPASEETTEAGGPAPIPHPIEGDAYADCTVCHGLGKPQAYPENHEAFPADSCTGCHKPAAEAPAAAETPAAGETPASEETAAQPNPIPHEIESEAYQVCTNCHGEGKPQAFPDNHKTFPPETCTSCHEPLASEGSGAATPEPTATAAAAGTPRPTQKPNRYPTIPHPVDDAYENCLACHDLDAAQNPMPESHTNFPLPSCTACHLPAQ